MRRLTALLLLLTLATALHAQDDGSGGTAAPQVPPYIPPAPGGGGALPPGTPIGLPPGAVPGGGFPGGGFPGGTAPGSTTPGGGFPPPTGTGTSPTTGGSAAPPPPVGIPGAGPGTPGTGGPPASGGGGAQIYRVTDEALLGPTRALQERGRSLFASRTLGRSALSCRTCHRPEDLRPIARVYPRYNPFLREVATLEQAQNACLARFMRASPLPYWSRNAIALSMFLVME